MTGARRRTAGIYADASSFRKLKIPLELLFVHWWYFSGVVEQLAAL